MGGGVASPLPASNTRPSQPQEPSTEHLLSPLLPARPVRKQTFPSPVPAPGSMAQPGPWKAGAGGSYLRPRALHSHSLQPVSTARPALLSPATEAAAPCPPVTRETASSSLPPTNQHRSHGTSQPMGDLTIPVPFQGPEPFPGLGDLREEQGSLPSCCCSKVPPWGQGVGAKRVIGSLLLGLFFCRTDIPDTLRKTHITGEHIKEEQFRTPLNPKAQRTCSHRGAVQPVNTSG